MNMDGRPDVIVPEIGTAKVHVFLNNGSLSFTDQVVTTGQSAIWGFSTADINDDGKPDLTLNYRSAHQIATYPNTTIGTTFSVGAAVLVTMPNANFAGIFLTAADLNSDGKVDIVAGDLAGNKPAVVQNSSAGATVSYTGAISVGSTAVAIQTFVGDVDGDGMPDILSCNNDVGVNIYRNQSGLFIDEITGNATILGIGNTSTLSNFAAGGTWSSSDLSKGTVDANGVVTAVAVGTVDITYTVTNGSCSLSKTKTITIQALANQAPTDMALSASAINENVAAASTVGTLSATDAEGGAMTYALVSGTGDTDNSSFTLTSGGSISINASPNFETKASYSVRIKVTDGGGLTFEKSFVITINNVNETPTDMALSASAINENAAANSAIGTLSSTDVDASNTFTYALVSGTGDTDNASFNISGNALQITASPDFETKSSYTVRIKTTDQDGLTYEEAFVITINNVNEKPTDMVLSASSINENVTANSTVGTFTSTDADAANTFTYALVTGTGDTDNAAFNISGNSLRITASPNFETKSSYSVRIKTTDQDGLTYEEAFVITINNVNETPTDLALSASAINENVAANSSVGTFTSTDVDASNTFTYTLVSGTGSTDNAAFNINGNSLRITASPNFENQNSYSVRIRTTDQGGLTFEKEFVVTINNVNEAPTGIFLTQTSIAENSAANTTVGTLSPGDPDPAGSHSYSLVTGAGDTDNSAFNISGTSLRFTGVPDYDTKSSYSIRMQITDQDGLTFERTQTITVTNVNELPTDIALSASAINENVTANSAIGTLSTTDPDAGNTFTYTLVSGTGSTDNDSFNISSNSLRITASPDFETKNSYSVRIRTTDQDGLTYEKAFAVTINNLNEAPSDIALSASTINENVTANSTVGTLSSTDVDAANTFTYTLVSGIGSTDNTAFNISGNSLRITASPDFETKNSYSVRVRTTDQGGLTYEEVFAVTINNVNETPTDIALSASSINENVTANSTVGLLSSTDVDASNTFVYSLVSGIGSTDNASFNISGSSLRITASPDFETKNSYSVRIRTTDQDGLTYEEVFAVTINNVNETPSDIALSASSINENVTANSTVGLLSSTDVDASNTFTYSLVSGTGSTDNASFNISGSSLRISASPDFETKNSYSVRIKTTDQGGLSYEEVFAITINDVTELVFTTTTLPAAMVGANYQEQINVTSGNSPYTFTVASGALPAGLTLAADGKLSGTPTAGGTFNVSISATDQNSVGGTYAYTLNVASPTLTLTASLANATVGAAYNKTIATTGGTAPYTYALTVGSLPQGLSLSSAGALTGTPTVGGTFNFTVSSTDSSTGTGPFSNTKGYALIVDPTTQTITFNANGTATYGDADFDPAATSTNQSTNITYSSSDVNVATIVNNKVHVIKTGTVTIYADQAANATYTAAAQKSQTLIISPKTLTVALTGSVSKTYNNTNTATLAAANFILSGKVGTDVVNIAAPVSGTYNNENVGTGKLINVSGLSLAGADQANYQLASGTANANVGVIIAKPVTLTLNAVPAITKLYDRNTVANLVQANYSLSTVESGDDVTVNGTATYDNNAAGTGKVVSVSALSLSGADKDNYSLTTTTTTTTGEITAKPISVALNASPTITKVYDGNTTAAIVAGNYTLTGIQAGDAVTVSGTVDYDNKNVGTGKIVTANTLVLGGADKNNYSLTTTTTSTTGSITANPINLVLNAAPAITKVYDGNNSAILVAGNYGLVGVIRGDMVSVTGTATYDNASKNTGKTVTANAFVLGGADKDNYSLTTATATTTGAITAKPITWALNATPAITKVYDGNTTSTLGAGNYSLSGIEAGDVVTVSSTSTYNDKTVGLGKTITVNNFVLGGAAKDNYSLTTTGATTTGAITTKSITLALNATPTITKVYDGNTSATLAAANYSLTGLLSGDVVTVTGTAIYNNTTANTGKTITANTFALGGVDKDNYDLTTTTASSTGTIAKANLVITADNKTRVQNTPDPVFTAIYTGFVNSETNAVLTNQPTFTTTATIGSLPGTYPIVPAAAAALNYNISYVNGTLTVTAGAPTSITLTQVTLYENRAVGTQTGTLSSTSNDPNATFTYTLVAGVGDTDNGLFAITGQQLNTASVLNFEQKASYSIRIRSTTQLGLTLDRVFTVTLTDVNEAPIFNTIANQTICAIGDRRSLTIGGISAGPESSQTTSFTLNNSNAALFSELTVANNGVINYRTTDGKSGVATITVTLKDNGGTANGGVDTYSQSFTITVNPLPDLNITTEGNKIELAKGETLVLKASGGTTYSWVQAQGIIGNRNTAELTVRPEATTTYTVEATSAAGCSTTKSITITVKEDLIVVKGTNILSPNGDGKNDRFVIRNIDMYPNNTVKIYDRAGRLLFSQVNYTDQFDGTFKGSPLAEDTYYYIVDFGPSKTKLKGFITIVRD
jgi:gliding motility-associated-like protein